MNPTRMPRPPRLAGRGVCAPLPAGGADRATLVHFSAPDEDVEADFIPCLR